MKSQRKTAMGAGGGRVFKENRKYREGEITDWEKGHEFSQRGRHLPHVGERSG